MLTNEWSLVLFTLLVQTSVGLLVVSEAARLADGPSRPLLSWQNPLACAFSGLGLLLSLTHLGTPLHSVFTVLNLGNSWLSREIMATGVFFVALLGLTRLRAKSPEKDFRSLVAVTMLLGLTAIVVMSNVYRLVSVPVWNTVATVLGFFGTALLMGAVGGGLLYALQLRRAAGTPVGPGLSGIFCATAVLGLALLFLGIPLSVAAQGAAYNPGITDQFVLSPGGLGLLALRIVLVFAGAVLFAWTMYRTFSIDNQHLLVRLSAVALACVFAGEVLGRLMFYTSYLRMGL